MEAEVDGGITLQGVHRGQVGREFLSQLTGRELMDTLMAADMPMGGTQEERIERLLSVMQPQDIAQFLPESVLERRSCIKGLRVG